MNPKKHPLEIFRKHGAFSEKDAKQRSAKSVKPVKSGKEKKPSLLWPGVEGLFSKRPEKDRGKNQVSATPGDWKISMSLNQILFVVVIVMVISLGTYFLGYHKGLNTMDPEDRTTLKNIQPGSGERDRIFGSQPTNKERVTLADSAKLQIRWGIQVVQYSAKALAIAEEAEEWLNTWLSDRKKNVQARLRPLQDSDSYIIIIGSFADQKNQELNALLKAIQSIDSYPKGSDNTPFEDAKIISFYIKDKSGQ